MKGMDDERERHKREMSDNLQEMQEIQDKTRVESLLSQFRYKEADMIVGSMRAWGILILFMRPLVSKWTVRIIRVPVKDLRTLFIFLQGCTE